MNYSNFDYFILHIKLINFHLVVNAYFDDLKSTADNLLALNLNYFLYFSLLSTNYLDYL